MVNGPCSFFQILYLKSEARSVNCNFFIKLQKLVSWAQVIAPAQCIYVASWNDKHLSWYVIPTCSRLNYLTVLNSYT